MGERVDTTDYFALGRLYQQQNQPADAILAYQKALFCHALDREKEAALLEIIGDLSVEVSRWLETVSSYRRALLIRSDSAELYCKLGRALVAQHRHAEAIASCQRAIALQSDLVSAHFWLGAALAATHQLEDAISAYTQVIALDENHHQAYQNLSAIFTFQNNAAGVAFCERQLGLRSRREFLPSKVFAHPRQSKREKPIAPVYSSAPEMNEPEMNEPEIDESVLHYFQLANDYFESAQFGQAITFYKIAQKLAPNNFRIAVQLQRSVEAFHKASRPSIAHITPATRYTTPKVLSSWDRWKPASSHSARECPPRQESPQGEEGSTASPTPRQPHPDLRYAPASPPLEEILPGHRLFSDRSNSKALDSSSALGKNNDYTFITQQMRVFVDSRQPYSLPVSIIIPTYNRKDKLAKLLAALIYQSYPSHLIEVIVADDGSSDGVESVIQKYQSRLTLIHVRQSDEGFRLAKVCNLGIACAKHDNIILLQCDMVPPPGLVEAYMQYLHVTRRALLIGGRRFVCTDEVSDDQILENIEAALNLPTIQTKNEVWKGKKSWQDWRIPVYEKTDNLKTESYPFRTVVGSNLAFTKQMVAEIGGFDEDFCAWGGEDHEFGYRAYNAGYYFIPVEAAICLHQEPPGGVNESDRKQGQKLAKASCEEKCPLPLDRKYQPDRVYEVPKVSVYVLASQGVEALAAAIENLLSQRYTDVEICVVVSSAAEVQIRDLVAHYLEHLRVRWLLSESDRMTSLLSNAKGAYVGFLRLGKWLRSNAVETLVNYLDSHENGCVLSGDEESPFWLMRKRDWIRTTWPESAHLIRSSSWEASGHEQKNEMLSWLSAVCSFGSVTESLYLPSSREDLKEAPWRSSANIHPGAMPE